MNRDTVIRPGQTIGIVGGGQLGRMMAVAARAMGYRSVVLDPAPDSPGGQAADHQIVAAYSDSAAAAALASRCDVVTYEFENVDSDVLRQIGEVTEAPQGVQLLEIAQHRWREKQALQAAGIPVAPFRPIRALADLQSALQDLGSPVVVKTTRGGYDGKGQWTLAAGDDLGTLWREQLAPLAASVSDSDEVALIAEGFVPFERELSVVVTRNPRGQVITFPVAENVHENHILHVSIVPARVSAAVQRQATALAEKIAAALDAVGTFAVELFLLADGQLYVNELAPRPHNSGHYSLDACSTSQFEQHVRAICNLPLQQVKLWTPVVMVNVLGQHMAAVQDALANWPSDWKLHLYGKAEARQNRKMGHVNILCDDVDAALGDVRRAQIW